MRTLNVNEDWIKAMENLMRGYNKTPFRSPFERVNPQDMVRDPNPPDPPGTIDVTFEEIKDS